ncbi:class I SAM-dependent RNA methyltransferase [Aurantiacibacter aquimixticola]|uniref:Class I SAM-dependent RNA methyltransferase n=1 Tax=Aurantiacibacter aquimixticola TaxID=1958945 RepID=A0A419RS32_9SPHN|nr:RsmD family RNA methyltransferase [Aurantiacibacter aquimixticola]RJY08613.1 class I SAM-dependent RNA methyltransferase [Aurantiacibacter aquimixticola]
MNETEEIVRIAARGDGVTASGRHVAGGAPGDRLTQEGAIISGPHHVEPPCRHFDRCGGCQLQHCDEEALTAFVRDRVVHAASGQGLEPEKVLPPAMSPPKSRRKTTMRAVNGGGRPIIGFNEGGSHKVVDLTECHVLLPELFALIAPLRRYLAKLKGRYGIDINLARVNQGVDLGLKGFAPEGLEQAEDLLDFCREHQLARLTLDQGYGPEPFWEPEPATITLGGVAVAFPPGAFMQATRHGENALVKAAMEWLGESDTIADLFAGLGTFAFALSDASKVTAYEAEQAAVLACRSSAARARKPVETAHRDLFRNPLRAAEISAFDAVLLDPPRAGARAQIEQIAASAIERVAYISCNPSSWSRDGKVLAEAGFRLAELRPVGQFRWSTHVELASLFVR